MSIFTTVEMTCPECGEVSKASWASSVNAERHPDLREQILDGSFQAETCPSCQANLRLPSHVAYLDINRNHWMLVEDISELAQWTEHEAKTNALFDNAYGPKAPKPAQELGKGVQPRLVFGWQALREKLVCTELSLDDVSVELMKLAILRNVQDAQLGNNIALRLISGDEENLKFNITENHSEKIVSTTEVPRAVYDEIVSEEAAWKPLREQLAGETFVDVARLMIAA